MERQLVVKICSVVVGLIGLILVSLACMNVFNNAMNLTTSMTRLSNGMTTIPSLSTIIDPFSLIEGIAGMVMVLIGLLGYVVYPLLGMKDKVLDSIFQNKPASQNCNNCSTCKWHTCNYEPKEREK